MSANIKVEVCAVLVMFSGCARGKRAPLPKFAKVDSMGEFVHPNVIYSMEIDAKVRRLATCLDVFFSRNVQL
jgi:hypothetical protein